MNGLQVSAFVGWIEQEKPGDDRLLSRLQEIDESAWQLWHLFSLLQGVGHNWPAGYRSRQFVAQIICQKGGIELPTSGQRVVKRFSGTPEVIVITANGAFWLKYEGQPLAS